MAHTPWLLSPRNVMAGVGVLGMLAGAVLRDPGLFQMAAGGVAAVAFAWWQAHDLLRDVIVQRDHHPRAFQGGRVAVELLIAGGDGRGAELIRVEESFPPAAGGRLRRLIPFELRRGTASQISYTGSCDHRRGAYIIGPVVLDACDPLGMFPRRVDVPCFTQLVVLPQALDLASTELLGEGILRHVGLEVRQRVGSSEEFVGVRDYRHGDPPRRVHWPSTARQGRLMVKEFQEEITTTVTLFLDLGKLGLSGVGDQTSLEYSVRCCASIARRATELGHHLQYFGVAEKVDHVPTGAGMTHLLTILDRLAFARAEGDSAFLVVVHDLVPTLPMGGTCVVTLGASTVEMGPALAALGALLQRRILPVFVLMDDRAFIKIFRDQEDRHHASPPIETVAQALKLAGARVHVVRRGKVMEDSVVEGLSQPQEPTS